MYVKLVLKFSFSNVLLDQGETIAYIKCMSDGVERMSKFTKLVKCL